jgi:hypothetical protein
MAVDDGSAGSRRQKASQHLHGGGFTGPVGPQETKHFTGRDGEIQPVYRGEISIALGQAACLDPDFSHCCLPSVVFDT